MPWLAVQGQGSFAPEQVREFEDPPTRTVRLVYAKVLARRRLAEAFSDEVLQAVGRVLPDGFLLRARNASEAG